MSAALAPLGHAWSFVRRQGGVAIAAFAVLAAVLHLVNFNLGAAFVVCILAVLLMQLDSVPTPPATDV